jgi:putative FmdB family regulatory protein
MRIDNGPARNHSVQSDMTYEYACTACGHVWEAEQSISAAPLTECPTCKQATAKRQVSGGAGFILKGGGWYADLYSSGGSKKKAEGSSESSSAPSESKAKPDAAAPATTTTASPTGGSSTGASST